MYQFSGLITINNSKIRSRRIQHLFGTAAIICEECYKPIFIKCNITKQVYILDESLTNKGEIHLINNFNVHCPFCGHNFIYEGDPIDPNIAYSIAELNRKGYKTLFSCEGHINNTIFKDAYIYFYDKYQMIKTIISYPLPKTWNTSSGINRFIIRSKCIKLSKRIKDLELWVESLPIWKDILN